MSEPRALVLSALSSAAGKTTLTLGLLAALRRDGWRAAAAKSGPDYIDPQFHAKALDHARASTNLDAFAQSPQELRARARDAAAGADILVIEGAMGLFDGAATGGPLGAGSTADLAAALGAPVVLILDVAKTGHSAAALALGAMRLREDMRLAGVILNRVRSPRHRAICAAALEGVGAPVLASVPATPELRAPARHLGLVQPEEIEAFGALLARASGLFGSQDVETLASAAAPLNTAAAADLRRLPPLGQKIAVARDAAFRFAYPHQLDDWRALGAELTFFSPLNDEPPGGGADAVFLPGGYPELHAGRLAAADRFRTGVQSAAARGAAVYGECGGYMTLGEGLVDARGARHQMVGLLPVETRFDAPKLTLGYRRLRRLSDGARFIGHEHHHAQIGAEAGDADRLFAAEDAAGRELGVMGLRAGCVSGSFAHVIAPADAE